MNNLYPNLFIVGAMKAGTTSVSDTLRQHRDIFVPEFKEPQFFCDRAHFYDSKISQSEYLSLYKNAYEKKYRADCSTWYLYDPDAAESIKAVAPNAKIVIILREPASRAISHYYYLIKENKCNFKTILEALEPELSGNISLTDPQPFPFVAMGHYTHQIERYLFHFHSSQVKILLYEDLKNNPHQFYSSLYSFLNLDFSSVSNVTHSNVTALPRYRLIQNLLQKDNKAKLLIKKIIKSEKLRRSIRFLIESINSKQYNNNPLLVESLKKHYLKEVKLLSQQTGLNLERWGYNR